MWLTKALQGVTSWGLALLASTFYLYVLLHKRKFSYLSLQTTALYILPPIFWLIQELVHVYCPLFPNWCLCCFCCTCFFSTIFNPMACISSDVYKLMIQLWNSIYFIFVNEGACNCLLPLSTTNGLCVSLCLLCSIFKVPRGVSVELMCRMRSSCSCFFSRFSILFLLGPLPWNLWERYLGNRDEKCLTKINKCVWPFNSKQYLFQVL